MTDYYRTESRESAATHEKGSLVDTGAGVHAALVDAGVWQVFVAEVAAILEESTQVEAALDRVLPLARVTLGWDIALVWGIDASGEGLRWLQGTAEPATGAAEFLDTSRYLVLHEGLELAGQAWAARAPVWSTALEECGARVRALAAARAGLHSGVAIPIISAGSVHGVLECFSRATRPHEPATERTLTILAMLLAHFMGRLTDHDTARASILRLAQVASHTPIIVYEVDTLGVITLCEGQGLSALGLMPGDLIGRTIADVHGNPSEMFTAVSRALSGEPAAAPLRARDSLLHMYWSPLSGAGGIIQGATGVATVVSEHHYAETLLHQSEEFFDAITRDSRELVSVVDGSARLLYASPSYAPILGYDPQLLVGRGDLGASIHPDDAPAAHAIWQAIIAAPDHVATVRLRRRHADGSWRWLEVHYANYLDAPEIGGVVCNARDVTDLVAAQEELQRQATLIEALEALLDADQGR